MSGRFAEGALVVGIDGDDTLWHNEDAFDAARDAIHRLLAPWAPPPVVDEALAETERRDLALYGYGVKGFTLSVVSTAVALSGGQVPGSVVGELVALGRSLLERPVELLPGVPEAVERLAAAYRLVLVTKGDLLAQETKVAASGLGERFEAVEVVSEKDPETYARVLARAGVPAERFVMVGNSERSDVAPVLALGGWAVHVPYAVTWEHEVLAERPESPRRADAASLGEVADLLLGG